MTYAIVYKALRPEEVAPSEAIGTSRAAIDAADGFVHLSTAPQIGETLTRHFRDLDQVVLYAFRVSDLGNELVWEPSRGGADFPHLYGPLRLEQATRRWVLTRGEDGVPQVPGDL
ncbi:MAG: DUF952 domain-containing protein [Pseudomonadota bacterium]